MSRKSIASYIVVAGIAAAVTAGFSQFGVPEITSAHALSLAPAAPVAAPLGVPSRPLPDIATLVEQYGPAVVNIKVSSMAKAGGRPARRTQEFALRGVLPPFRRPGRRPAVARRSLARRRLRFHRQRRWCRAYQRARSGRCFHRHRAAHRRPGFRGQGDRCRQEDRYRGPAYRCQGPAHREDRQSREYPGRRMGGGHRLAVRLRKYRHGRDRQRQVALAAGRKLCAVHPDRCSRESRQLRRAAVQPRG